MGELDWMAVGLGVLGALITTGGGLLSLTTDPERPAKFVPVYLVAMTLFGAGLWLLLNCDEYSDQVRSSRESQTTETSSA